MNRRANLVLAIPPRSAVTFDELARASEDLGRLGLGGLAFVRDGFVDDNIARYEFALRSGRGQVCVIDDHELDLRYVSVRGSAHDAEAIEEVLRRHLPVLAVAELIARADASMAEEGRWLNALALGSASPTPEPVRHLVTRQLGGAEDRLVAHALEAVFLLGADQFRQELAALRASGSPAIRCLIDAYDAA